MVRLTFAVIEPIEFLIVIVKEVVGKVTSGFPMITHVNSLRLNPVGSEGVAVQLLMAEPLFLIVLGITVISTPTEPSVPGELA